MKKYLILLVIITLVSCERGVIYDNSVSVSDDGYWNCDTPAVFRVEISDTNTFCKMGILVRNSIQYGYSNLFLFVEETTPDSVVTRDTVEYFLADDYGRWIGSGFSTLYTNLFLYQDSLRYSHPGTYTYTVRHGMRDPLLPGITDIGLKLIQDKR